MKTTNKFKKLNLLLVIILIINSLNLSFADYTFDKQLLSEEYIKGSKAVLDKSDVNNLGELTKYFGENKQEYSIQTVKQNIDKSLTNIYRISIQSSNFSGSLGGKRFGGLSFALKNGTKLMNISEETGETDPTAGIEISTSGKSPYIDKPENIPTDETFSGLSDTPEVLIGISHSELLAIEIEKLNLATLNLIIKDRQYNTEQDADLKTLKKISDSFLEGNPNLDAIVELSDQTLLKSYYKELTSINNEVDHKKVVTIIAKKSPELLSKVKDSVNEEVSELTNSTISLDIVTTLTSEHENNNYQQLYTENVKALFDYYKSHTLAVRHHMIGRLSDKLTDNNKDEIKLKWIENYNNSGIQNFYVEKVGESLLSLVKFYNAENTETMENLLNTERSEINDRSDNQSEIKSNTQQGLINAFPEIFNVENKRLNSAYVGLVAWTANFTPFVTNLSDAYIKKSLSSDEEALYTKYGTNRSIVFIPVSEEGTIKSIQDKGILQYKPLTLAEFIDRGKSQELAFFVKRHTEKDITVGASGDTFENSEQDQGGFISNRTSDDGLSRGLKSEKNEDTGSTEFFVGPFYTTSGEEFKDIITLNNANNSSLTNVFWGEEETEAKDTLSSGVLENAVNSESDKTKERAKTAGQLTTEFLTYITGSTLNLNYVMLYNNLENQQQYSGALKEDMNKPLYVDFLGNVVTKSGYVVIPSASNLNIYTDIKTYPMFNAYFLNSYPDIRFDKNSGYTMTSDLERNKYIYLQEKSGLSVWAKFKPNGKSLEKTFNAPRMFSAGKTELSPKRIEFMDAVKSFKPNLDTVIKAVSNNDFTDNKMFINNGAIVSVSSPTIDTVLNLRNISHVGSSNDWNIIKEINYNHITPIYGNKLNQVLLANIAVSVKNYDMSNYPYESKYKSNLDKMKEDKFNSFAGKIFEGVNNRIISSFDKNYLLFTPTPEDNLTDKMGVYTQRVLTILTIIGLIAIAYQMYNNRGLLHFSLTATVVCVVAMLFISKFSTTIITFIVDYGFNKPAQIVLKDDIMTYMLLSLEDTKKLSSNGFYDESSQKEKSINGDIVITKVSRKDAIDLRTQRDSESTSSIFYRPELDTSRVNILGNLVYLENLDVKIGLEDFFNTISIKDKATSSNSGVELLIQGPTEPRIATHTPYYEFVNSLVFNINQKVNNYSYPTRLIRFSKGTFVVSGRFSEYVKSIEFIKPDKIQELINLRAWQYNLNREDLLAYYNEALDPLKEDQSLKNVDNQIENRNTEIDNINNTVENNEKVSTEGDITLEMLQKKRNLIVNHQDKELFQAAIQYLMSENPVEDRERLNDWLGLRNILHLYSNHDQFKMFIAQYPDSSCSEDMTSEEEIKKCLEISSSGVSKNVWWPVKPDRMLSEQYDKLLREKIYRVNENTRRFVINRILPISDKISDETLIKVVALYATIEYNKEFSDLAEKKLYPRSLGSSLNNEYTTKAIYVPIEKQFLQNTHDISRFITEETGWLGLLLAAINTLLLLLIMISRAVIIGMVITLLPIFLIYLFAVQDLEENGFARGSALAVGVFSFVYIIELFQYKLMYWMTNNINIFVSISFGLIMSLAVSYSLFWYITFILRDFRNFGYERVEEKVGSAINNFRGINIDESDLIVPNEFDYFEQTDSNKMYNSDNNTGLQEEIALSLWGDEDK